MRNILIVDDNTANRMVLKALMDEYIKETSLSDIAIFQAVNGAEAVKMCEEKTFELVFMDIMMPVMDGIEATGHIKAKNRKVMIVAVSALNDEESKCAILDKGAEDYIVKPVSPEVLKKRLNQYFMIINSRQEERKSYNPVNVIDSKIFSRRLVFIVHNEKSLAEFWEYYLVDAPQNNEHIIALIRILYGLGSWQLKLKYKFEITVEKSESSLYFTMNNMKLLNSKIVENIIEKNYPDGVYWLKEDKITFSLPTVIVPEDRPGFQAPAMANATMPVSEGPQKVKEEPRRCVSIEPKEVASAPVEEERHIYDFMEQDDLEELRALVSELNSLMLLVGSSQASEQEVLMISGYIEKFGKILNTYGETYDLYSALNMLALDIRQNVQNFRDRSADIGMLCVAFNNDLSLWLVKLFEEGAPSINFLDNSIISNANMLSGFIRPAAEVDDNVDDIFDF